VRERAREFAGGRCCAGSARATRRCCPRARRRQQRPGSGARLRLRLRQQPGPARGRRRFLAPEAAGLGRWHGRHRAHRTVRHRLSHLVDPESDTRTVRIPGRRAGQAHAGRLVRGLPGLRSRST
jgi:hypothetical protein